MLDIEKDFKEKIIHNNLSKKPFASGMYLFMMFMIDYYTRVKDDLNIDYDSFMIIQTVASHSVYHLKKNTLGIKSYKDIQKNLENNIEVNGKYNTSDLEDKKSTKLTISSIALVTKLPKETVRRKINELIKREILRSSNQEGITVGSNYKKIFNNFVPKTAIEIIKLIKSWEKSGVLESMLKI